MEYLPGDFTFIIKDDERYMMDDAYIAITKAGAWEIMKLDPGDGGYLYSKTIHPDIVNVKALMKYEHHSIWTYGLTMRSMQYISTQGWNAFVNLYANKNT